MEQLGLFDAATTSLVTARRALARFDLDEAEQSLAEHVRVFGSDRSAQDRLNLVRSLRARRDAFSASGGTLDAIFELGPSIPADLLEAWHARVAQVAEREHGVSSRAAGELPGFHWLAARDYTRAIVSLRAALEHTPGDARARAFLGDAHYSNGHLEPARREYLKAFVDDAIAVAVDRIADPAVIRLVDLARHEYDLGEPAAAWVPAVGVVERVFGPPQPGLPGMDPLGESHAAPRAFLDLIARERAGRTLDERVAVRRRMKELAPLLFDAYLRAFA